MKSFITALLATVAVNASAQVIDRSSFVDQLSTESCVSAPQQIFIDTNKEGFDMANALGFSWVALQTLDNDSEADLDRLEAQWNVTNVKLIEDKKLDVRVMVAEYNDAVFLTFRHTDTNLNWLLNVDLGLWNFPHSFTMGEKVHHGFGSMLGAVWNDVVSELRTRTQDGKRVHVFGHSLGGAFALLSGPGLKMEGFDVAQVYATGSPKVGSVDWAASAEQVMGGTPVYRITNGKDLFSRIPVGESSLDEFRDLFSFIPTALTRTMDIIRYRMPFGLVGQHITMTDDLELITSDVLTNDIEEQTYWQTMADQFKVVDENSNNIVDNAQQKVGILTNNLNAHLIRQENGYACKMTELLKSGR